MPPLTEPGVAALCAPVVTRRPAIGASTRSALAAALVYVVVGAVWILASDWAIFALSRNLAVTEEVGILKGWAFVGLTGTAMFWYLRRRFEEQRDHYAKLQVFVEHAPVAIAMFDREMRYVTVSRRWRAAYGLHRQDLDRVSHYDLFPTNRWREVCQRALAGETLGAEADRFERPDGTVQWLHWEVRPWLDDAGAVGGVVIFFEDITERAQAEEALAESQRRLRLALKCGHVGIWSWDLGTGQIECDEATAGLLGRTRAEFLSGGAALWSACIHPEDRAEVQAALERTIATGADYVAEYRVIRPDGCVQWLTDHASVERSANGKMLRMIGACVDITAAKRIERALHDTEDRFREVVETIREVFWIRDVQAGRMIYVSPAYEEIWGQRCEDLYAVGRDWLDAVHPEDRARVQEGFTGVMEPQRHYEQTYRITRPDGAIRWVREQAYPVRDDNGQLVRVVGTAEDVTEAKQLEEQFLRAQRLEAIGTLASGVAHDLNNILAPMLMIAPLLKPKLADQADVDILEIVERSAQRGAHVVRQLLTFSRGIAGERGPLQIRHLVTEMVAIMTETFPRHIGITHQVPARLPVVIGDATQLHQVLMNLCVNARDAMPEGGRLSIVAREVRLTERDVREGGSAKPGDFVVLSVCDTGQGIPANIEPRIFEPFFTTKELGKGTGLGLSTVLGIVKSHGGFITVESRPGHGSTFHVHLPAAAEVASLQPAVERPLANGLGQLVLVVDDEAAVRSAMGVVLERAGYRVMAAGTGREALKLFLVHRQDVAVVVTDLMMPEMGGLALARALRDLNPDLPIIAATGLQGTESREALAELGVRELLPKPYAPAELLDALTREAERRARNSGTPFLETTSSPAAGDAG